MPNTKGFTLIELLIVILIIGILSTIAVPMMRTNVDKAKKAEALAALGTIKTAQRLYYTEYGKYASSIASLNVYLKQGDLKGRYYNSSDYSVSTTSGSSGYNIYANNATVGNVGMNERGFITGF